jgi:hypothetical protein
MIEGLYIQGRRDRRVGQDHIDLMERQCRQQFFVGPLAADDSVGFRQIKGRLDQLIGDELRQDIGDADREPGQAAVRPAFQRAQHLLAEREDFIRVAVNYFTGLG